MKTDATKMKNDAVNVGTVDIGFFWVILAPLRAVEIWGAHDARNEEIFGGGG